MTDDDKASLVARYDAAFSKLQEENARLRVQLREVTERLSMEGAKFQQNWRDETQNGMAWVNIKRYQGWVVVGVIVVIAIVAFAINR